MNRVMIVTNSLSGGGAESSLNLVANELSARGWSVALVPINSGPSDLVIPTCPVFALERNWQSGLIETLQAFWRFNILVKKWNPKIIVLNCDLPELFGSFLFSRRMLVAVEHVNRPWVKRVSLGKLVRWLLRRRKVNWVAVSSHLSIWPDQQSPQAILLNSIAPSPKSPSIKTSRTPNPLLINRLMFVGRLAPQKRPNWLLQIAWQNQIPVEFFGDGSLLESLKLKKEKLGVDAIFHRQVRDPWSFFEKGDILVVPSEYEGDGLVVIEALQLGLPLLVADIPEFRRFGFPEKNYCKTEADFSNRLSRNSHNVSNLKIPLTLTREILAERTISNVGNSWVAFFNCLLQKEVI